MAVHPKIVQIKRTQTPGNPPVGLLPGELSVEMNDPLRLWVGVPASIDALQRRLLIDATAGYVLKSGDTMTGSLSIKPAAVNAELVLDKPTALHSSQITGKMNGSDRWRVVLGSGEAEAGANAGSNFRLTHFADDGTSLGNALAGLRATGLLTVKGDPTAPLGIATKQYVDGIAVGAANSVRYDIAQVLNAVQREQARENIYAAPFDAIGYFGMQTNGGMEVNQEFYTTPVTTTAKYVCDGWLMSKGGTMAFSANTPTSLATFPGYQQYIAVNITTAQAVMGASDLLCVHQVIEGYRMMRLAWGQGVAAMPITIGFWSAHHRTGLYSGAVRNNAGTRSYAFTYNQDAADVRQWQTVTIPGCPDGVWDSGTLAGIWFTLNVAVGSSAMTAPNVWTVGNFIGALGQINGVAATSDIFRVTGVMILPGGEAPLAERAHLIQRPFHDEYRLCERYYQKSNDPGVTPGTGKGTGGALACFSPGAALGATTRCFFHTMMRTAPTLITYNPINADANWYDQNGAVSRLAAVAESMTSGFRATINAATTGNSPHYLNWSADARYF